MPHSTHLILHGMALLPANLEDQIDHELLDILGHNDTIKPLSGIAMMPSVLENDFLDIEEAYVVLDELLVYMQSTLYAAFQCPTLDSPIVPPPTNIFKGPRNLGELSPSATVTTTSSQ